MCVYASVRLGNTRNYQVSTFCAFYLQTSIHTRKKNIQHEVPEAVAAHMTFPCSPLSARLSKLAFTRDTLMYSYQSQSSFQGPQFMLKAFTLKPSLALVEDFVSSD